MKIKYHPNMTVEEALDYAFNKVLEIDEEDLYDLIHRTWCEGYDQGLEDE